MTKRKYLFGLLFFLTGQAFAQTNPAITEWIINTTGATGSHYVTGNSTPISDPYEANVQTVSYSADYAYANATGIPSYIIGPYQDGNPAQGTDNDWIFKIPLNPVENTGTLTSTPFGSIGVFINGVPMYDYKDGQSYSSASGSDSQMAGDGVWNRNAILAEMDGFDCAKGHPSPIFSGPPGPGGTLAGGRYHHHQNPSAFDMDLNVLSTVCNLYDSDGLYSIDPAQHSPLIGFAFDGFPVYGAYGYANTDGTGGIKRIESSYQERSITVRTHYADGTNVTDGPAVNATYPIGWYREDYEYIANSGDLDDHNGRFCVTPEYPLGTYAYFATVDDNWNSTYPYMVGPQYYGVVDGGPVNNISEPVTVYTPPTTTAGLSVNVATLLEGPYVGGGFMATDNDFINHLPINQPYTVAPWNYAGTESATSFGIDVIDWMLLELRDKTDTTLVEQQAVLLLNNGLITATDGVTAPYFANAIPDDYFIVLRHRNHLDVISQTAVSLPNTTPYNFGIPSNILGGTSQLSQTTDGYYTQQAGDYNGDGVLSVFDFNGYVIESSIIDQYMPADFNLNSNVTVTDYNYYRPNLSSIGVSIIRY